MTKPPCGKSRTWTLTGRTLRLCAEKLAESDSENEVLRSALRAILTQANLALGTDGPRLARKKALANALELIRLECKLVGTTPLTPAELAAALEADQ
jgi:hypothetical protein